MITDSSTKLILLYCSWVAQLGYLVYWVVQLARKTGRFPINFYITDIYAAMLGLIPAFLFAVYLGKLDHPRYELNWLLFASLIFCQVLGMIAGRISSRPREVKRGRGGSSSSFWFSAARCWGRWRRLSCMAPP